MPETIRDNPFEDHAHQYDQWFDEHRKSYQLELNAVRELLPAQGRGIEVGAGTGRFIGPLGITSGIEPVAAMRAIAAKRGLELQQGSAENLPLESGKYDYLIFVTTLCFVDSVPQALQEAHRVLREDGILIIGMIDSTSSMGKEYKESKGDSTFYKEANFYSIDEMVEMLHITGFNHFQFRQTLLPERKANTPSIIDGYGSGAFVVIRSHKSSSDSSRCILLGSTLNSCSVADQPDAKIKT